VCVYVVWYVCVCVWCGVVCVCVCGVVRVCVWCGMVCVCVCSPVSRVFQKAHADRIDNRVIVKICSNKTAYHFPTKFLVAREVTPCL
jgi:hypothetical protein